MKILLCCSAGMSTSLLVNKMKVASSEIGVESKIWAIAVEDLPNNIGEADIVLLGPQIRFKLAMVEEIAKPHNKPVEVINMMDYGTMNGKKILENAITTIKA